MFVLPYFVTVDTYDPFINAFRDATLIRDQSYGYK